MDTRHWGRSFWTTLFATALEYPEKPDLQQQHHYKRFYEEIRYVLPCDTCKRSYRHKWHKVPINPFLRGGRQSLFSWVLKIYNLTNLEQINPTLTAAQVMLKHFPSMTATEANLYGQTVANAPNTSQLGGGNGVGTDFQLDQDKLKKILMVVGMTGLGYWAIKRFLK